MIVAKLYFKHGVMGSSKTANLLMTAHNYEAQGKRVKVMKSSIDNRWGVGFIESRSGIEKRKCDLINISTDLFKEVKKDIEENGELYAVLIDEAQFLSAKHVRQLAMVVDYLDVPVVCFGLKNTYQDGKLFEGSEALLYYADKIEEIKTVCQFCNRKATMNLRVVNGLPVYTGESSIVLGDTFNNNTSKEYYIPVCRHHYWNPLQR